MFVAAYLPCDVLTPPPSLLLWLGLMEAASNIVCGGSGVFVAESKVTGAGSIRLGTIGSVV